MPARSCQERSASAGTSSPSASTGRSSGRSGCGRPVRGRRRRFVTRFAGKLEELEQAAPQEIKRDVGTLLAGQRDRAGLPTATKVEESEGAAAETRIRAWEKRNCQA